MGEKKCERNLLQAVLFSFIPFGARTLISTATGLQDDIIVAVHYSMCLQHPMGPAEMLDTNCVTACRSIALSNMSPTTLHTSSNLLCHTCAYECCTLLPDMYSVL